MTNNIITCPRCNGKTFVDKNDIIKLGRENLWRPGVCNYCSGTGKVLFEFAMKNPIDSLLLEQPSIDFNLTNKKLLYNINEIFDTEIKNSENRFFQYGNYPELFRIPTDEEVKTYKIYNSEYLFALCLNYDGDDLYHITYDEKNGFFIKNGSSIMNSDFRLKYPIKIADKISEIFGIDYFKEKFIERYNDDYYDYQEASFHQYEDDIEDNIPDVFNPKKDMRLLYKEILAEQYFSDHKEYSKNKFKEFFKKSEIVDFSKIEAFYETKPYTEDFMKFINEINQKANEKRYLFLEFYQSAYIGIIDTKNVSAESSSILLKYGIIYNKMDVSDQVYELLC